MQFSFKNPSCFADYITKRKNGLHGSDRLSVDSNWRFWLYCPWFSKSEHYELDLLIYRGLNHERFKKTFFEVLRWFRNSPWAGVFESRRPGEGACRRKTPRRPSYPISDVIYTTLDRTVVPQSLMPRILPRVRSPEFLCRVSSLYTLQTATVCGPRLRTPASIIRSPTLAAEASFAPSGHQSFGGRDAFDFLHHKRPACRRQRKPGPGKLLRLRLSCDTRR